MLGGLLLLPAAVAGRWLAFQFPGVTERWYGAWVYPVVGRALGALTGWMPFSVAEAVVLLMAIAAVWFGVRRFRARRRAGWADWSPWPAVRGAWYGAGLVLSAFLVLWGLNYARPPLSQRMGLDDTGVEAEEVLELGRLAAGRAAMLFAELGQSSTAPTTLPLSFESLNETIDASINRLALPGDRLASGAPAKRLWGSVLLSYLGISGIFIPFTGEPSVNRMVLDASLPLVVAHEKAHQRGIANEGEANLVAVMACAAADEAYVRYAAWLYVGSRAIGAAFRYLPDEARDAWDQLGPGRRLDLAAEREFWARYRGPASQVATRVNDAYLKSNRVPGGVQSYGQVVRLLVGAQRAGRLKPFLEELPE